MQIKFQVSVTEQGGLDDYERAMYAALIGDLDHVSTNILGFPINISCTIDVTCVRQLARLLVGLLQGHDRDHHRTGEHNGNCLVCLLYCMIL